MGVASPLNSVGVDQVGQIRQPLPLADVVLTGERWRVGAETRLLDLDVAADNAVHLNRVVRADLKLLQAGLSYRHDVEPKAFAELPDQRDERRTQGIFRLSVPGGEGRAGVRAECLDRCRKPGRRRVFGVRG